MLFAENFSFCTVPNSGQDALLFGSVAVLVTVVLQGKLSAVWVLIAGARYSCLSGRKPAKRGQAVGLSSGQHTDLARELCHKW